MTPTATYIAEENCLQELPKRERPDATKILGGAPTGVDYEVMDELMDEYYAHLATLRKIPCDPSCKGLWQDQQKVVENVDYEIKWAGDWKWCYELEGNIFAAPIVPKNGDDELWNEVLDHVFVPNPEDVYNSDLITFLKSKYIITKR